MADGARTHDPPDSWKTDSVTHHLRHLVVHLFWFLAQVGPGLNLRNAACRGVLALAVYLRSAKGRPQ